eukprot:g35898.t1
MMLNSSIASSTVKNCNDLLRRQTQDTTDRVPFVIQYFPGVEKLRHVLHSLQHAINDDEHLANIFVTPSFLTFKQPPNLKQTIVRSELPSLQDNIDRNTTQPCHGNRCKTCQIINMDTTVTCGNSNTPHTQQCWGVMFYISFNFFFMCNRQMEMSLAVQMLYPVHFTGQMVLFLSFHLRTQKAGKLSVRSISKSGRFIPTPDFH